MNVTLNDTDRIVLRYDVLLSDDNPSGSFLLVVIDQLDVYSTLFHARSMEQGVYDIVWRGNSGVCLEKFTDEVDDFEHEHVTKVEQAV